MRNWFSRLLFPPHCAACRRLLPFDGSGGETFICRSCRGALETKKLEACHDCGASFVDCRCMPERMADVGCRGLVKLVAYDPAELQGVINKLINNCKRYADRALFEFMAKQLCFGVEKILRELEVDRERTVVTYCPRSLRRVREYGFDQAELLAECVADVGGYGMASLLTRRKMHLTKSQKNLGFEARALNAKHSVSLAGEQDMCGKTVVLVDDVVTSGATMAACVSLLMGAGADNVICVAIAEAVRDK